CASRGVGEPAEIGDDSVDEQDVIGGDRDSPDPDRETAVGVAENEDRLAGSSRIAWANWGRGGAQSGYSGGVRVLPGSAGVGSLGGCGDGECGNSGGSHAAP